MIAAEALEGLHPAVRRYALRSLAERVAGRPVALGRERAAEIWRLAQEPEGGVVELGGGVEARLEHGHVRFALSEAERPAEAELRVPGTCRFGAWEVRAELRPGPEEITSADIAALDPDALTGRPAGAELARRRSDPPLGLAGTKTLQDVFTDRKVPRSLRRTLPVITCEERIAWVAGVAVSEEFAAPPGAARAAVLSATVTPAPRLASMEEAGETQREARSADAELIGETLVAEEELQARVSELGAEISRDYAGRGSCWSRS